MTATISRVATLSPAKLKLLARRLERTQRGGGLPRIVPDLETRHEPFPLTEVQEAYWLGRTRLFDLGGVSAHGYNEIEIEELDLKRFERALVRVIARHDMLRMVVRPDGLQQILPEVDDYQLRVYDLSEDSEEAAKERRLALRAEMSHQVLDASTWPLFDIRACRLPDSRVRLHISFDILVADLTGYQILMRDLARFYADPTWSPPPLELSFRDYVLAHERLAESDLFRSSMEYWSRRLDELQRPPELPLAQDPSRLEAPRFSRRVATLSADRWRRLKSRAAQARLSSSGLLIAAFSEVLTHWSKEPHFTLTLTLFNALPLHPQVHEIVGDFTSLALLSVDGGRPGSFESRARAIQEQLGRDLEHSQVGGVRVLRELARKRGMATAAMPVVLTSSLVDGDSEDAESPAEGLLGESVFSISQTPQVWLDHQVYEQGGALHYNWDAVRGLFPKGLLDEMFTAYRDLLGRLIDDEAAWSDPLPLRLPAEQQRRRERINATAAPVPEGLLHRPFEDQLTAATARPAILTAEASLDYAQVDRSAAALARVLAARGAGRGRRVAVVMEKGWEQVVAVLAILRAGATYLPVSADLPAARIRYLLERGEVTAAVVQDRHRQRLEELVGGLLPGGLVSMGLGEAAPESVEVVPPRPGEPDDLAYVLFTSGSTGRPKGVMIDHRGALNTVVDVNRRFAVCPEDRVLGLSSLSFDLSVWDIFGLLGAGGAVVLPEPGSERDPGHWAMLMERHRVTLWNTVPALMEMLVEDLESRGEPGPGPLRLVMLSGDWIPVTLPDRIRALWPDVQVVSLGGATEASIWSILYPIGEVPESWSSIPYGRPMKNQTFEVLGPRLERRPDWVPGDLYIGGIGLARGYWGDPEQTATAFIVHPRTGERLYRTGDLGRWLPQGEIEFLGREDFQVKIQGHRIELGEIEVGLEQHPEVRAAVVDAVGEARGPRSLVAWVVPARRSGDGSAESALDPADRTQTPTAAEGDKEVSEIAPSVAILGALFAHLQARDLGGSFRKRRYASAGNLYPVQAYLEVGDGGAAGLESGCFYYDPHEHWLVRLSDAAPCPGATADAGCTVHLLGDRGAIAPVYPEWADHFLVLEAGYLLELLAAEAPALGLALRRVATPGALPSRLGGDLRPLISLRVSATSPAAAAPTPPGLERGVVTAEAAAPRPGRPLTHSLEIAAFKLDEPGRRRDLEGREWLRLPPGDSELGSDADAGYRRRASHRAFLETPLDGALLERCLRSAWTAADPPASALRWYLVPRLKRVQGLEAAVYRLDTAGGLEPVGEPPARDLPATIHGEVNRPVYQGCSVSLFAVLADGEDGDAARLEAGRLGQRLMENAGVFGGLGFCPIGSLDDEEPVRRLLALDADDAVVHSFVAGGVAGPASAGATSAAVADAPADADDAALIERLQRHLEGRLPAYMVPGVFLLLDRLPLSANGKVDRKALPRPGTPVAATSEPPALSRPWEKWIAALWCELLGLEAVRADDNFFALGGDSVRAIRVLGRLRQLGVELSPRELFEATSLRRLSDVLEEAMGPEPPDDSAGAPVAPVAEWSARDAGLDADEIDDLVDEFGDLDGGEPDDDF